MMGDASDSARVRNIAAWSRIPPYEAFDSLTDVGQSHEKTFDKAADPIGVISPCFRGIL